MNTAKVTEAVEKIVGSLHGLFQQMDSETIVNNLDSLIRIITTNEISIDFHLLNEIHTLFLLKDFCNQYKSEN